jgi:hypothetical protein
MARMQREEEQTAAPSATGGTATGPAPAPAPTALPAGLGMFTPEFRAKLERRHMKFEESKVYASPEVPTHTVAARLTLCPPLPFAVLHVMRVFMCGLNLAQKKNLVSVVMFRVPGGVLTSCVLLPMRNYSSLSCTVWMAWERFADCVQTARLLGSAPCAGATSPPSDVAHHVIALYCHGCFLQASSERVVVSRLPKITKIIGSVFNLARKTTLPAKDVTKKVVDRLPVAVRHATPRALHTCPSHTPLTTPCLPPTLAMATQTLIRSPPTLPPPHLFLAIVM